MYYNNRPCSTRSQLQISHAARRILAICIVFRDQTLHGWENLENEGTLS